jgi:hypothetical protein
VAARRGAARLTGARLGAYRLGIGVDPLTLAWRHRHLG